MALEPLKSSPCMKNNLLRTFFEWALITSVLMSVGFFVWYYFKSHTARGYVVQVANEENNMRASFERNGRIVAVLMAECQQYARTNADLARLLAPQKPVSVAPAAPTPTARPKTR